MRLQNCFMIIKVIIFLMLTAIAQMEVQNFFLFFHIIGASCPQSGSSHMWKKQFSLNWEIKRNLLSFITWKISSSSLFVILVHGSFFLSFTATLQRMCVSSLYFWLLMHPSCRYQTTSHPYSRTSCLLDHFACIFFCFQEFWGNVALQHKAYSRKTNTHNKSHCLEITRFHLFCA